MNEFELFSEVNFDHATTTEGLDLFAEELEDRANACISTFFTAACPCSTLSTATTVCTLIPSSGCPTFRR